MLSFTHREQRDTTNPNEIVVRPHRLRVVCFCAAAVVFVAFTAAAVSLKDTSAGMNFGFTDQVSVFLLGVLAAIGIIRLTRPTVRADEQSVRVRNLAGEHEVSWDRVHAVRFPKGSPWASLELTDEESLSMWAIQSWDGERAVIAMTELRRLLTSYEQESGVFRGDE